ncbi:MAG TPA: cyclodeaminase/cyclohydrolase family protein [Chitinophagaceae bacterium]|nr:cyclodeaminase/cyclohydrolase family protein [Chitinophagaceae bacterium]
MIRSSFIGLLLSIVVWPGTALYGQESVDSSVWNKKVLEIIALTARNHPKVTGGCITLTSAGLNVSLIIMALEISNAKEKDAGKKNFLNKMILEFHKKLDTIHLYAELDLHVFDDYLRAVKLPDSTLALKAQKKETVHNALLKATISPLNASGLLLRILQYNRSVISYCTYNVITDLGSAGCQIKAGLDGMLLLAEADITDLPLKEQPAFQTVIKNNAVIASAIQKQTLSAVHLRIKQHK